MRLYVFAAAISGSIVLAALGCSEPNEPPPRTPNVTYAGNSGHDTPLSSPPYGPQPQRSGTGTQGGSNGAGGTSGAGAASEGVGGTPSRGGSSGHAGTGGSSTGAGGHGTGAGGHGVGGNGMGTGGFAGTT